jgi:hypothetical protein
MYKDLVDTASSPSKKGDVVMSEADYNTKRCLTFEGIRSDVDKEENQLALATISTKKAATAGLDDSAGKKRHKK